MNKEIIQKDLSKYTFVIKNFEGPLDLLVYLISKNKMNIFDISLNDLTDKYIEYLNTMSEMNLEITSEFILMATTLLNIKSKKLLPEINDDEEDEITEQDIIAKIVEYKKYKEISEKISNMYNINFGTFSKYPEKINFNKKYVYDNQKINKSSLYNIYKNLLEKNENKINSKANDIKKLALYEKITVKDKVKQIISYLDKNNTMIFNNFYSVNDYSNLEVITAFLGVLELSKLKQVDVEQQSLFSDIFVSKNENTKLIDINL